MRQALRKQEGVGAKQECRKGGNACVGSRAEGGLQEQGRTVLRSGRPCKCRSEQPAGHPWEEESQGICALPAA